MNYYLVTGTVEHTPYMRDTKEFEDIRLVKANNSFEAEKKYKEYWNNKSEQYYAAYFVYYVEVMETIE